MTMAEWDASYVNDLPDSAFLVVLPGGHKDAEGKTLPRTNRYFPVRDATGKVDAAHLRNALSRIPQSTTLSANQRESAMARAKDLAKSHQSVGGPAGTYEGSAGSGRSRPASDVLVAEMMGDQFRDFAFPIECRAEGDGRTLVGRAVPYGVAAQVGNFAERFMPGAFAKQIASGTIGRVKVYESHHARLEGAPPIGKTAELHERQDGAYGAWPLFSTSRADDALELVRSGEVTGLSVGFRATPGGSVRGPDGVIERRVAHLDHIVLTHEPAYAEAGVVAVRSEAQPVTSYRSDFDRLMAAVHPD
jgi:HK97 family phage prohead protease